ncbi:MAG: hypothetical protein LAT76_13040 [Schleiferiaceae bacterium]|nr:hypothetical protein [Schleiferiaceae bacterium]
MIRNRKLPRLASALALTIGLLACSSDDNSDNNNNNGNQNPATQDYFMTFDIAGGVEGAKSGFANVIGESSFGVHTYMISGFDGGALGGNQTFSLTLYMSGTNGIPNPEVGTYPIGDAGPALMDTGFWVVYTDTENGFQNAVEYGLENPSGELTITNKTSRFVEGTFTLTAGSWDTSETIQITNGKFKAKI